MLAMTCGVVRLITDRIEKPRMTGYELQDWTLLSSTAPSSVLVDDQ